MQMVAKPLDVSMLSMPAGWEEKNYSMVVRRFKGRSIEVVTRVVKAMQQDAIERRHTEGWLPGVAKTREPLTEEQIEARHEENKWRAVRRAKQAIRWAVKANGSDHMLTLSYRENMQDVERLGADWKEFVRLVKKGLPASGKYKAHAGLKEFRYVACRERQDRGAWHLHVAVVGRQDIGFLRRCWMVAVGGSQDDEGDATVGTVNVRGPSKRWGSHTYEWKADKLAGYMTKYLHKCFDELEKGKKRYWASRHNEKPEVVRIWLACADFTQAIKQTHDFARANGVENMKLWASDGWDVVWCAG